LIKNGGQQFAVNESERRWPRKFWRENVWTLNYKILALMKAKFYIISCNDTIVNYTNCCIIYNHSNVCRTGHRLVIFLANWSPLAAQWNFLKRTCSPPFGLLLLKHFFTLVKVNLNEQFQNLICCKHFNTFIIVLKCVDVAYL
jgi:hypothetical protein